MKRINKERKRSLSRSRASKFTLIELLVVIAIIGILASLLLPVLAKSRKTSRIAVCLSNQKQIGFAVAMYAGDNDSRVPKSGDTNAGQNITWDDRLGVGYDGRDLSHNEITGVLPPKSALYICPVDDVVRRNTNRKIRSYAMNQSNGSGTNSDSRYLGMVSNSYGKKITEVNKTATTVLMFDYPDTLHNLGAMNRGIRSSEHMAAAEGNGSVFWTHYYGKANFLMVDGSAKGMSLMQTFLGIRSPFESSDESDTMWDSFR
ncbi:type II secretion system protein [Lentisphaera profundi]|uniref:Type II secretion system protein n=1 Tax=Lentisphaera profundi TaxID=1658616 RepID=A0ABY7VTK9_9BACT|nr:type II secretion system protein [Lentisphaera profundi]WDE96565.1 type II secretion system protein [Lentisphaera profundi]